MTNKFDIGVYRRLFMGRASKRVAVGGVLARFLGSSLALGFITMYTNCGYSYTISCAAASLVAFSCFVISPRVSRLIDHKGQSRVIPGALIIALLALAGVLVNTHLQGPLALSFALSVLIGAAPSVQSLTRARWSYLIHSEPKFDPVRMKAAFSFEGIMDEVTFMLSPALVVILSSCLFAEAGLLINAVLYVVGMVLILSSKDTEPEPVAVNRSDAAHERSQRHSVVAGNPTIAVFFTLMLILGIAYGMLDPATYAFTSAAGVSVAASGAFAISGLCSVVVGSLYGMIMFTSPLVKRLVATSVCLIACYLPMFFIGGIPTLYLAHGIGAMGYTPFVILLCTMVDRCVQSGEVTEALTFVISGETLGTALGPLVGGWLIDVISIQAAFWGCAIGIALIPIIVIAARSTIARGLARGAQQR